MSSDAACKDVSSGGKQLKRDAFALAGEAKGASLASWMESEGIAYAGNQITFQGEVIAEVSARIGVTRTLGCFCISAQGCGGGGEGGGWVDVGPARQSAYRDGSQPPIYTSKF